MNPGAHPRVEDVDVEHRYPPLLAGEGELRAHPRVGVTPARRPHVLELLGAPDGHHLRAARLGGGLQVRAHHIGLALPGPEPDHRDAAGLRPVPDLPPELLPDRLEQRRGRDWLAPVIVQEVDHPARSLQPGYEAGQIQPVQARDVQRDVTSHHVRGSHHRRVSSTSRRHRTSHFRHPSTVFHGHEDEPASRMRLPEPGTSAVRGGASLGGFGETRRTCGDIWLLILEDPRFS